MGTSCLRFAGLNVTPDFPAINHDRLLSSLTERSRMNHQRTANTTSAKAAKFAAAPALSGRAGSRRRFLAQSAAVGASLLGCPAILKSAAPNSTLQVASIGVGGMGGSTMKAVASHSKVKIVALCDVDQRSMDTAAAAHPEASKHRDWREMLASHADKFDAVTIGTPDHMHAAPAVIALRAKKHVYLQKPMAPTLHECRVITQEAAKAGVVTQLGNQGRSSSSKAAPSAKSKKSSSGKTSR
jgi:hypothetical protein